MLTPIPHIQRKLPCLKSHNKARKIQSHPTLFDKYDKIDAVMSTESETASESAEVCKICLTEMEDNHI
jgi:cell fate (sporulation/competence/biofilm development) regulator YmcA (YheA/YmcA/DUF963 family)